MLKELVLSAKGLTYQTYPMPKRMDVSSRAVEFLFEPVHLDGTVRLTDLLKLFETCPTLRAVYRRSFVDSILDEAAKGPLNKDAGEDERLEFLEVYRTWSLDTGTQTYSGVHALQLHGVGPALSRDYPEHYRKAGERIQWSLSMTSVRELLDVPLRIDASVSVCEDDIDAQAFGREIGRTNCEGVMLGQLLEAVFDEIAFHGGPAEQEELAQELKERMDSLDTAKTVSLDELFDDGKLARFDRPGFAVLFETLGDVPKGKVRRAMRELEDDEPAAEALTKKFEGRVVVRPEYRELGGRAFRKAFREAVAD